MCALSTRRIAGLTAATVKKIISHRETTGTFINREQLTSIKGLGPKTYKQCAGFVRVMPLSRGLSEGRFVCFHCFNGKFNI